MIVLKQGIQSNIHAALSIVNGIISSEETGPLLFQKAVPLILKAKVSGNVCQKIADILIEAVEEASLDGYSTDIILNKCAEEIEKHYNRVIGEILDDLKSITTDKDCERERRKIEYKVKRGYLEKNLAEMLLQSI